MNKNAYPYLIVFTHLKRIHKKLIKWITCRACAKTLQSCLTLCDPMDCSLPGSSAHGDSPGMNTGVGCHFLLQGTFLTQGSNLGLLDCRQTLYQLSYKGSLKMKGIAPYSRKSKPFLKPSACVHSTQLCTQLP